MKPAGFFHHLSPFHRQFFGCLLRYRYGRRCYYSLQFIPSTISFFSRWLIQFSRVWQQPAVVPLKKSHQLFFFVTIFASSFLSNRVSDVIPKLLFLPNQLKEEACLPITMSPCNMLQFKSVNPLEVQRRHHYAQKTVSSHLQSIMGSHLYRLHRAFYTTWWLLYISSIITRQQQQPEIKSSMRVKKTLKKYFLSFNSIWWWLLVGWLVEFVYCNVQWNVSRKGMASLVWSNGSEKAQVLLRCGSCRTNPRDTPRSDDIYKSYNTQHTERELQQRAIEG